jgi:tetratricopeptide (TPR) repeat protein
MFLKDMYAAMEAYSRAVKACEEALKLKPNDHTLIEALSELHQKADQFTRHHEVIAPEPEEKNEAETHREAAQLFFAKARKVTEQGNYDYAIDLYIDGLRRDPEALEEGHLELARLGLKRHAEGGKKPSMVERAKSLYHKTPLEQMLNAEYLFTKDPTNTDYAESMLKAAVAGEYHQTAGWIANLIFQTNNALQKPSFQTYLLLKDVYQALGQLDKAVAACQWALKLRPDKDELAEEYKNLTAELTMAQGKYGQGGDFRDSIKDARKQEHLYAQDRVVKTEDWRLLAVDEARKAFAANPNLPNHIFTLASALSDLENEAADSEALQILETAYHQQQNFSFKEKAGQLHIKHIKRKLHKAKSRLQNNPDNEDVQTEFERLNNELVEAELEHYRLCVENYPTNRRFAYEYAIRLAQQEHYDDAIPLFQEARKDPARRILSMNQIGLCFFQKNWLADAIDVFSQAIDDHELEDDGLGKELRYNLGRAYEAKGETAKAVDIYRKIAQADFAYKDISDRVNRLRSH